MSYCCWLLHLSSTDSTPSAPPTPTIPPSTGPKPTDRTTPMLGCFLYQRSVDTHFEIAHHPGRGCSAGWPPESHGMPCEHLILDVVPASVDHEPVRLDVVFGAGTKLIGGSSSPRASRYFFTSSYPLSFFLKESASAGGSQHLDRDVLLTSSSRFSFSPGRASSDSLSITSK
jgi:hypothetical protein